MKIVAGAPTPEELAAVVAALSTVEIPMTPMDRPLWRDVSSLLRTPIFPGPGAWRASGLPH